MKVIQGAALEAGDFGTAVDRWGKPVPKNKLVTTWVPSHPLVETDLFCSTTWFTFVLLGITVSIHVHTITISLGFSLLSILYCLV